MKAPANLCDYFHLFIHSFIISDWYWSVGFKDIRWRDSTPKTLSPWANSSNRTKSHPISSRPAWNKKSNATVLPSPSQPMWELPCCTDRQLHSATDATWRDSYPQSVRAVWWGWMANRYPYATIPLKVLLRSLRTTKNSSSSLEFPCTFPSSKAPPSTFSSWLSVSPILPTDFLGANFQMCISVSDYRSAVLVNRIHPTAAITLISRAFLESPV